MFGYSNVSPHLARYGLIWYNWNFGLCVWE